jgi:transcriptional regulator GlxA family with amidase domain
VVTPATFVERVRVETARRLLEDTALPLDDVARAAGFQSNETFRRAFHRVLGVAPTDYRTRFRVAS